VALRQPRLNEVPNSFEYMETSNPFEWMETIQGKTNFFEKRATEHAKRHVSAAPAACQTFSLDPVLNADFIVKRVLSNCSRKLMSHADAQL